MSDEDIVAEVRAFIGEAGSAGRGSAEDERQMMTDDLNFVYTENGQWQAKTLAARTGRPSFQFNRVLGSVNQVLGEQALSQSSIKARPVDDKTDPELAEVYNGMIRNIEGVSNADEVYRYAYKYAVAGGFGAFRIMPENRVGSFDQELVVQHIFNPQTVFFDPLCLDPVKRGQMRCAVAEKISQDFYEAEYGEKDEKGVSIPIARDADGWVDDEGVRIAEYFKKIPITREIAILADGRVVPYDDELKENEKALKGTEGEVMRHRKEKTFNVRWWKVDGHRILEGPIDYEWANIPVIKVPGRHINIEGRQKTQSLVRHAKDAQRAYNYDRTTQTEVAANAPRQPYLVTPTQIKGFETQWNQAGSANRPYLMFNPDPKAPTVSPQRAAAAEVPAALIAMAAQDADDIKATTGFFDASLGRQGNELSGKAIRERSMQSDVGSYEFKANLQNAIKYGGEMMVDMIPKVYDTARTVRILGLDGKEDFVKINAYDETTKKEFDLSQGSYDVSVDMGPAFATQQDEAFAQLIDAVGVLPMIAEVAPDLIMKNASIQDSDEIVKRLRKPLVANGTIEPNDEEREALEEAGAPPPDPTQTALIQSAEAQAAKDASTAKLNEAKIGGEIADTEKTQAETVKLKVETIGATIDKVNNIEDNTQ